MASIEMQKEMQKKMQKEMQKKEPNPNGFHWDAAQGDTCSCIQASSARPEFLNQDFMRIVPPYRRGWGSSHSHKLMKLHSGIKSGWNPVLGGNNCHKIQFFYESLPAFANVWMLQYSSDKRRNKKQMQQLDTAISNPETSLFLDESDLKKFWHLESWRAACIIICKACNCSWCLSRLHPVLNRLKGWTL